MRLALTTWTQCRTQISGDFMIEQITWWSVRAFHHLQCNIVTKGKATEHEINHTHDPCENNHVSPKIWVGKNVVKRLIFKSYHLSTTRISAAFFSLTPFYGQRRNTLAECVQKIKDKANLINQCAQAWQLFWATRDYSHGGHGYGWFHRMLGRLPLGCNH